MTDCDPSTAQVPITVGSIALEVHTYDTLIRNQLLAFAVLTHG
jgi:hypothetical protein